MGMFERFAAQVRARHATGSPGSSPDQATGATDVSSAYGTRMDSTGSHADSACASPCERNLARTLAQEADAGGGDARWALLFSGDVQGVGFRWTNQALAREHGLSGWTRNLDDGTVAVEIQGPPAAVAAHLTHLHAHYQRFGNRIWLESAQTRTRIEDERDFEVRW